MVVRQCLGISGTACPRITTKQRCPEHQRAYEVQRGPRRIKGAYDADWRHIRDQAIREHPWCTDCGAPDTPSNPLTGDHIVPRANGGRNVRSNVAVRCRACNSRKGARPLLTHT